MRRSARPPVRRRSALEALQPLRGQCDLRQQHQRLAALAQGPPPPPDTPRSCLSRSRRPAASRRISPPHRMAEGSGAATWSGETPSPGCSGSGMANGGDNGSTAGMSIPASAMPRSTPAPTPAARASSPVPHGSSIQRVKDLARLGDRASGSGSARRHPMVDGPIRGRRSAAPSPSPRRAGSVYMPPPSRRTAAALDPSKVCRGWRQSAQPAVGRPGDRPGIGASQTTPTASR